MVFYRVNYKDEKGALHSHLCSTISPSRAWYLTVRHCYDNGSMAVELVSIEEEK
jgi:hypothetical protein